MRKEGLKIGWAQTDLTPSVPVIMEGQMYMRASEYVHDPLTATAVAFDGGEETAVFVSMDMTEVPVHAMRKLRQKTEAEGIPFDKITFSVTHTHTSSSFYDDFMRRENEQVYAPEILPPFETPEGMLCKDEAEDFFTDRISALILDAWEARRPGGISTVHEYAAVAFSRRAQFETEKGLETVMYGDCSQRNFQGFEDGADTSLELLFTWDENREVTGVICNVPCPSQIYELHRFLSADYWGPARDAIRERLKKNVYILPVCGAAGDLCPVDLVQYSKTNKKALKEWGGQTKEVLRNFDMTLICQAAGERIADAVQRGYKTARNYIETRPVFKHEVIRMQLPIRQVSEEDYEEAKKQVEEIHRKFSAEHPMNMEELVQAFEPQGVILRYQQQKSCPFYEFDCHVIRLGRAAFATNPFELYQTYGKQIKARAEAEQVFILQLTNGCGGYLPTKAAVAGGSYSSKPASTTCGPDGGAELVEKTLECIAKLWGN